jgi:hypothetical protein
LISGGEVDAGEVGQFITETDEFGRQVQKNIGDVTAGAVSAATLSGASRENAIENIREMYASRLESLRKKKVLLPLAPIVFGERVLAPLYSRRSKESGDKARFSVEVFDDLNTFAKIIAINQLLTTNSDNVGILKRFLRGVRLMDMGAGGQPKAVDNIREILSQAGQLLLGGATTLRIPYANEVNDIRPEAIALALEEFQNITRESEVKVRRDADAYSADLEEVLISDIVPNTEGSMRLVTRDNNTSVPAVVPDPVMVGGLNLRVVESADGGGEPPRRRTEGGLLTGEPAPVGLRLKSSSGPKLTEAMTVKQLQKVADDVDVSVYGSKKVIIKRIMDSGRYTVV